jgi:hypothetical protein
MLSYTSPGMINNVALISIEPLPFNVESPSNLCGWHLHLIQKYPISSNVKMWYLSHKTIISMIDMQIEIGEKFQIITRCWCYTGYAVHLVCFLWETRWYRPLAQACKYIIDTLCGIECIARSAPELCMTQCINDKYVYFIVVIWL